MIKYVHRKTQNLDPQKSQTNSTDSPSNQNKNRSSTGTDHQRSPLIVTGRDDGHGLIYRKMTNDRNSVVRLRYTFIIGQEMRSSGPYINPKQSIRCVMNAALAFSISFFFILIFRLPVLCGMAKSRHVEKTRMVDCWKSRINQCGNKRVDGFVRSHRYR